jgi:hypothetical protein
MYNECNYHDVNIKGIDKKTVLDSRQKIKYNGLWRQNTEIEFTRFFN